MDEPVSAAEANRRFSVWLRGVRHGHSYLVTSHGRPVARIVPPGGRDAAAARARDTLLARLESQDIVQIERWTGDELYEDDQ